MLSPDDPRIADRNDEHDNLLPDHLWYRRKVTVAIVDRVDLLLGWY